MTQTPKDTDRAQPQVGPDKPGAGAGDERDHEAARAHDERERRGGPERRDEGRED